MPRYDTRDISTGEKKLTRAIHYLWRVRCGKSPYMFPENVITEALETLFQAKRDVKADLKRKSTESFKKWRGSVGPTTATESWFDFYRRQG